MLNALYNQVDEEVHKLVILSNKSQKQLESLLEVCRFEEQTQQVRPQTLPHIVICFSNTKFQTSNFICSLSLSLFSPDQTLVQCRSREAARTFGLSYSVYIQDQGDERELGTVSEWVCGWCHHLFIYLFYLFNIFMFNFLKNVLMLKSSHFTAPAETRSAAGERVSRLSSRLRSPGLQAASGLSTRQSGEEKGPAGRPEQPVWVLRLSEYLQQYFQDSKNLRLAPGLPFDDHWLKTLPFFFLLKHLFIIV